MGTQNHSKFVSAVITSGHEESLHSWYEDPSVSGHEYSFVQSTQGVNFRG